MSKSPVKKIISLLILYSIIIIGIFVLQFRNESVLSKNTGLLSISLAQTQAEDGSISLKDNFTVSFKGISFFSDEAHPASLIFSDESRPLVLVSYEQPTSLSYKFNFSDGDSDSSSTSATSLTFSVSDTTSSASLSVFAEIPKNARSLVLNYKPASGFSVTDKTRTKLQLNSKNLSYVFAGSQISDETVTFTKSNAAAYYSIYNPEEVFTFASVDSEMAISQKSTFDENISQLKSNLISQVASAIQNSQSLTEKTYIAYVAELASQGRFTEAVSYVPNSFKRGNQRTYLSAPYFDTLETMYPSLAMHNSNLSEMISNAISTKNLNVFTTENLADYLNIISDAQKIHNLLTLPKEFLSNSENHLTLSQATGILNVYVKLSSLHSNSADLLSSVVDKCLEVIQDSCVLNDSTLTLHDKDSVVSSELSLQTGNVLVQLGDFNSSDDLKRAGYALINTVLAGTSLDADALGNAYPILVQNPVYPHFEVLSRTESNVVWAWTCAQDISYSQSSSSASITIQFNKNDSHYVIFNEIPAFTEIEIYGLSFHSDPRFESYNSSGFIYRSGTRTLFLKSRHKTEKEIVRLTFARTSTSSNRASQPARQESQKTPEIPAQKADELQTQQEQNQGEQEAETEILPE